MVLILTLDLLNAEKKKNSSKKPSSKKNWVSSSMKYKVQSQVLVKTRLRHRCSSMNYSKQFGRTFLKVTYVQLVFQNCLFPNEKGL